MSQMDDMTDMQIDLALVYSLQVEMRDTYIRASKHWENLGKNVGSEALIKVGKDISMQAEALDEALNALMETYREMSLCDKVISFIESHSLICIWKERSGDESEEV